MKRLILPLFALPLLLASTSCRSGRESASNPGNAAQNSSGAGALTEGMEEISEESLRKEVEQNPDDPVPHFNLGTIYLAQQKYAEAVAELRQVVAKSPQDWEAQTRLGDAHAALKQYAEAASSYEQSLRAKPDNAEARLKLSAVYAALGRTADAARERAEALRQRPTLAAQALIAEGKYREALAALQKVGAKDADTHYLIGKLHLQLGRDAEAATSSTAGLGARPSRMSSRRSPTRSTSTNCLPTRG